MSQLKILKASAGSGKTFNLVAEYIKLLIANPYNYRHVLAVTFTNKATSEMKERVIRDLFKLSENQNETLLKILTTETGRDPQLITRNARLALSNILHNYDRFSVSTIDSFFQRVLRSFARETGLYGTYEVELDYEAVLNEAADRLLLSVEDDEDLRIWLTEMSEDQLIEGKNWSIKEKILELGKELQKEAYQQYMLSNIASNNEKNDERKRLLELKNEVFKTKKWFEKEIRLLGKTGINLIAKHGLTVTDFKYKNSSFANFFYTISNFSGGKIEIGARFSGALDNVETWSSKELLDRMQALYDDGLNELIRKTIDFVDKNQIHYITTNEISKYIYSLGVLSVLLENLRETGRENNTLLLNEGTLLLKGIIGNNDAPFIYEKTGSFYHYFMIDEFQDTSGTQWQNFKPLIVNSLSENNPNLIVGDVKQSIYRWRNSDWQLLNMHIQNELKTFGIEERKLQQNWRSRENIIRFNNQFFMAGSQWLQSELNIKLDESKTPLPDSYRQTITDVYSDVEQKVSEGKTGGFVQLNFCEADDTAAYRETVLEQLIEAVKKTQDNGYAAGDIAILVRKNNEGKMVADALLNQKTKEPGYNFEVVSDDSLFIHTSPAVKLIIGLMQHALNQTNEVIKATVIHEFSKSILPELQLKGKTPPRVNHDVQQQILFGNQLPDSFFPDHIKEEFFPFFNPENNNQLIKSWSNLSLTNFIEEVVKTYNLDVLPGEQASIQSLKDKVNDFSKRESGNLHRFLEWWQEYGTKVKVQMAASRDAIRILTVHKSKGLEFPVVLLPFCDWEFAPDSRKSNIIWCPTDGTPYRQFPALPVKFTKSLAQSHFAPDYYTEMLLTAVDTINLLYVSFTRAVEGLFVFGQKPQTDNKGNTKAAYTANSMAFFLLESDLKVLGFDETKIDCFEFGTFEKPLITVQANSEINLATNFTRQKNIAETLKLRRNYDDFLEEKAPEWKKQVNLGKFMHEILAAIKTKEDVETALRTLLDAGKITLDRFDELKTEIENLLQNPKANDWFNGSFKVLNETSVLDPEFGNLRPDRVMISANKAIIVDYKTTDKASNSHKKQVEKYTGIITQMGYTDVEGYVWYLKTNEIVTIDK
ncbi:MAG: UvrD-helicase domain-containing protein [Prolixibacteraceae bacterium]|jgi:ATP-dependent helicase/nuclease subunit A|nr:UvrD-helicase domain-containing protein [Prolixibacteraceae bacterium]